MREVVAKVKQNLSIRYDLLEITLLDKGFYSVCFFFSIVFAFMHALVCSLAACLPGTCCPKTAKVTTRSPVVLLVYTKL